MTDDLKRIADALEVLATEATKRMASEQAVADFYRRRNDLREKAFADERARLQCDFSGCKESAPDLATEGQRP